jgi:hypothetical protein
MSRPLIRQMLEALRIADQEGIRYRGELKYLTESRVKILKAITNAEAYLND